MGTIWIPSLDNFTGSKYERLAAAIGHAIEQGTLPPGSKLPPQRRLADALGITLGTVTRAYSLAIQRGWVEARVGDGTYVRQINQPNSGPLDLATCQQAITDQASMLGDALCRLGRDPARLTSLLNYHAAPLEAQFATVFDYLKRMGIDDFGGKLVFTQGAQQALYAALASCCSPGDWVVHEAWCYPGLNKAATELRLNLAAVELTDDGLDLEQLETSLIRHKPKAMYLTPNNQNPGCIGYSEAQRQKLLALARRHGVLIIEDDVNYCTGTEWHTPLWQLAGDANSVVYIASLSKRFAGGIRFGFMLAPQALYPRVNQVIHAQCWMVSPLLIELGCDLIRSGAVHQHRDGWILQQQQAFLAMAQSLGLNARSRGLNGLLLLPEGYRASHLIGALASQGILARSLSDFGGPSHGVRFSLGRIPKGQEDTVFATIRTILAELLSHANAVV